MHATHLLALLATLSLAVHAPAAEPLRGAQAVLDDIAAQTGAPAQAAAKPLSETAKLRTDLTNFTARAATLAPAAAAREWLALGDRSAKLPPQDRFNRNAQAEPPLQPQELIAALPPPAVWDELAKAIAARPAPAGINDTREFALRMLGQTLAGDRAAVGAELAKFEALLLKAKREEAQQLVHGVRALSDALLALSDDPKAILAGVERQLTAVERERDHGYSSVNLPDLVGVLGEADATPLVRRAVLSKARDLSIQGKATEALARKLALALVNDLKVARWELADSIDSVELYEALEKKFTQAKPAKPAGKAASLDDLENDEGDNDYRKKQAQAFYLMGLIARGRAADATKFARSLGDAAEGNISVGEEALARAGFVRELDNFLHELLSQSPELPFWEPYFAAAARSGRTDRMLTLARAAAARPGLNATRRGNIRENLYRALLAADEVDEGVKELRALLATAPKAAGVNVRNMMRNAARPMDWQKHALTLARLGYLLEKPEWINEGLAAALPKADDVAGGDPSGGEYQARAVVEVLVQVGRPAEAEKMLVGQLVTSLKQPANQRGYSGMGRAAGLEPLKGLVALYHRAGRHADVLLLLEKSPHWGMKDLAQLFVTGGGMAFDFDSFSEGHFKKGPKGNRVAHAAAAALVNAGRTAEARAIVDAMLDAAPGDDRPYELLVKLASGPDALKKLDAVFARDQFEERPLIWKAQLLHQAGQHEAAEKVAKQAIAIDPSDGEQGKNDRMRVYAVLADIRAARGDAKEAEFLRGAVRAIRMSERADDFHNAGLLRRGVKMYQESLTHFADAYCIQSRLAVQLAELGLHELAAKHYEKAFELMPDSFGRVESHCFGCEGAFTGTQAQGVAERVFIGLVAKSPNKAQVHYLLGYLRQQQGKGKDAVPHYRRALQLDADYLNAWEHLEEVSQEHRLPAVERDAIAFNILRLDPLGRHASASLDSVSDLRKLWAAVEVAAKFQVKPPAALLPLAASREELEKQERAAQNQASQFGQNYTHFIHRGGAVSTPGATLAQHQLIAAISGLMGGAGQFGFEE